MQQMATCLARVTDPEACEHDFQDTEGGIPHLHGFTTRSLLLWVLAHSSCHEDKTARTPLPSARSVAPCKPTRLAAASAASLPGTQQNTRFPFLLKVGQLNQNVSDNGMVRWDAVETLQGAWECADDIILPRLTADEQKSSVHSTEFWKENYGDDRKVPDRHVWKRCLSALEQTARHCTRLCGPGTRWVVPRNSGGTWGRCCTPDELEIAGRAYDMPGWKSDGIDMGKLYTKSL
jgi:hypothetical protein